MSFEPINHVKIALCFGKEMLTVGRLASRDHTIYFEYDQTFIEHGLEISPLKCPLKPSLQSFDPMLFEGLPGVFNDSLPDGWGKLLLDRNMRTQGILPNNISPLDRLCHVGHTGMGALIFEPDYSLPSSKDAINIDTLAKQTEQILSGEASDILEKLLSLNGSSAGARPKAMIGLHTNKKEVIHGTHSLSPDYQAWLVKFPNSNDGKDAGAIEYVYAIMAREAGLEIPDIHLFPSKQNNTGYFSVKRFDRDKNNSRIHMHTASGLLHSDFRIPSLDYEDLIALTMLLTKDIREVEKLFRMAVFNVLAHNRDDHAKNFSFLMDCNGEWKLSPAYDLTFSSGPGGEQSTMVLGEGKKPSKEHLIKLGLEAGLSKPTIHNIIDQTRSALSKWPILAKEYAVHSSNIKLIKHSISECDI